MARPRKDGTKPIPKCKLKLTKEYVDYVKPEFTKRLHWDTVVPGLVLIVQPSGTKSWKIYYRRNGKPRWYSGVNIS